MGLLRGIARTAAVAGTATAVSNRVSRRQAGRWARKDEEQQQAEEPAPAASAEPAAPQPSHTDSMLAQLKQLGELHNSGVLSDEEFTTQKNKILAS